MMVAGLYDGNIAVYNLQKNTGQFSIKSFFVHFYTFSNFSFAYFLFQKLSLLEVLKNIRLF